VIKFNCVQKCRKIVEQCFSSGQSFDTVDAVILVNLLAFGLEQLNS